MSIIEAAKEAHQRRLVNEEEKARQELWRMVNQVLGPYPVDIDDCCIEPRPVDNFYPLNGRPHLTLDIHKESLEFMAYDGQLYVKNYRRAEDAGPDWYWNLVKCLADLGTLTFEEVAQEAV